jgi:hypothetical protein
MLSPKFCCGGELRMLSPKFCCPRNSDAGGALGFSLEIDMEPKTEASSNELAALISAIIKNKKHSNTYCYCLLC